MSPKCELKCEHDKELESRACIECRPHQNQRNLENRQKVHEIHNANSHLYLHALSPNKISLRARLQYPYIDTISNPTLICRESTLEC
jgi:hypothetical protein